LVNCIHRIATGRRRASALRDRTIVA